MSYMRVFIKEKGVISGSLQPTCIAKELIEKGFNPKLVKIVKSHSEETSAPYAYDAGFLLFDFDSHKIISNQRSFSKDNIKTDLIENWEWKEAEEITA